MGTILSAANGPMVAWMGEVSINRQRRVDCGPEVVDLPKPRCFTTLQLTEANNGNVLEESSVSKGKASQISSKGRCKLKRLPFQRRDLEIG